jgi:hypothetical protein
MRKIIKNKFFIIIIKSTKKIRLLMMIHRMIKIIMIKFKRLNKLKNNNVIIFIFKNINYL